MVFNTTINGGPAFRSGDLLQAHPTREGFWRVYGRVDDQIILSTGEKVGRIPYSHFLMWLYSSALFLHSRRTQHHLVRCMITVDVTCWLNRSQRLSCFTIIVLHTLLCLGEDGSTTEFSFSLRSRLIRMTRRSLLILSTRYGLHIYCIFYHSTKFKSA